MLAFCRFVVVQIVGVTAEMAGHDRLLARSDLVVEAVPENLALKHKVRLMLLLLQLLLLLLQSLLLLLLLLLVACCCYLHLHFLLLLLPLQLLLCSSNGRWTRTSRQLA